MSHVYQGTIVYRDLDALRASVGRAGGEWVENKTSFGWWGKFVGDSQGITGVSEAEYGTCLHEIKIPGTHPSNGTNTQWSIGVVRNPTGDGYKLRLDYYGSSGRKLTEHFGGRDLTKIADEYAAEVAMRQLARQGFRATRTDAPLQTVR